MQTIKSTCCYCGVGCGVTGTYKPAELYRCQGRPGTSGQFRPAVHQGIDSASVRFALMHVCRSR